MYFNGIGECFFFRHVELNPKFILMTIDEVILDHLKNRHGLQRYLWFLSVETLAIHHEVLCWNLSFIQSIVVLKWILNPIRTLPNLPHLLSEYLLFKFFPREAQKQERCLIVLSFQTDEFLINLSLKSNDIQSLLQKILLTFCKIQQIVFHTEFSYQSEF